MKPKHAPLIVLVCLATSLQAQFTSFSRRDFFAGPAPTALVTADFDRDGHVDLAAGNLTGISILLGKGDGSFETPRQFELEQTVIQLVTADFNGDGVPDLATGAGIVLLGTGNGSFRHGQAIPSAGPGGGLTVADFTRDGKPDLVIGARSEGRLVLLAGMGDGTFAAPAAIDLGSLLPANQRTAFYLQPSSGDFNGDGIADLAIGIRASLAILMNKGSGQFGPPIVTETPNGLSVVTAADFTGDGKADVAVAYDSGWFPPWASVLVGKGDGTFQPRRDLQQAHFVEYPVAFAFADFNRDGRTDLAVGYGGIAIDGDVEYVTLYTGSSSPFPGNFFFGSPVETGKRPTALVAGDFDGDGRLDLAVAAETSSCVSVLLNRTTASPLVVLSAASNTTTIAPGSLATVSVRGVTPQTLSASENPPTTLGNVGITVQDSSGLARPARILYVSPLQINFEIPAGLAEGAAAVTITGESGPPRMATAWIDRLGPGLFTVGVFDAPSGYLAVETSTGFQVTSLTECRFGPQSCALIPIETDSASRNYVWLFGTGMRGASDISVLIGGTVIRSLKVQPFDSPLPGVGPAQPLLDHIAIELPKEITGSGAKRLMVMAEGRTSNVVWLQFK